MKTSPFTLHTALTSSSVNFFGLSLQSKSPPTYFGAPCNDSNLFLAQSKPPPIYFGAPCNDVNLL